jgi:hypothetical protein
MALGRASSGYKIPNGGRGFPAFSQKRPGGYTISLTAVTSDASCNHIIFDADSTFTYWNDVVNGVGFLSAVITSISIANQYLLAHYFVMSLIILSSH